MAMTETGKKIPIGLEDYRELVTKNYYYVDKTLLIKDVLENGSKVMLFTRPRRFGKTLNLSMLDYFFNIDGSGKGLFDDCLLARSNNPHTDEQGQYPVISLSLKEMKKETYELAVEQFRVICAAVFKKFSYLLDSKNLFKEEKEKLEAAMVEKLPEHQLPGAFLLLMEKLHERHKKQVVFLLDEYDVPLQTGYIKGYYDRILDLIRSLMSMTCKTNPHLRLAVHTGCLRIAGESIYIGFNNPYINTILSRNFDSYFGFTPAEVQDMLNYYGLGDQMPAVREWYDGYLFGAQEIYNPWSILNYIVEAQKDPNTAIQPYWANTYGNDLLLKFFECSLDGMSTRNDIERLLDGEPVTHAIDEHINYKGLQMDKNTVWNILFFSGYLRPQKQIELINGNFVFPLVLVNQEIHNILPKKLEQWYATLSTSSRALPLIKALENGKPGDAELVLNDFLMRTVSFRDRAENFYHGFIAGLLSNQAEYDCRSNRESGDGLSDILLERRDSKAGTVIEVKMAKSARSLTRMAETALKQAVKKGYAQSLEARLFANIHVYGIACFGKKCCVRMLEAKGN